jgi:hypothetical protein
MWWLAPVATTRLHDGNLTQLTLGNDSGGSGLESSDGTLRRVLALAVTCDRRDGVCCDQTAQAHGA